MSAARFGKPGQLVDVRSVLQLGLERALLGDVAQVQHERAVLAQREPGVHLALTAQLVGEAPFAADVVGEGQRLVRLGNVGGRVAPEDVADVAPGALGGGASHHRLDSRADVLDLQIGAHERDDVGRMLHEVAEVRTTFFDAQRRLFGGGGGLTRECERSARAGSWLRPRPRATSTAA